MTAPLHIEYAKIIQKNTEGFREELVQTAFAKMLPIVAEDDEEQSWSKFGIVVVKAADAVLAAMERIHDTAKNPTAAMDKTPDTGPSVDKIARIREQIQDLITANQALLAECPTEARQARDFREGSGYGLVCALKLVAAMETMDTGPSVDDGVEKPILARIRAEIQARLDVDAKVHENNPTTNVRARGYREGFAERSRSIVAMIDEAMGKTDAGAVDV